MHGFVPKSEAKKSKAFELDFHNLRIWFWPTSTSFKFLLQNRRPIQPTQVLNP